MDDDMYRDMLWAVCRVRSSKQLDLHGLNKVLQHMVSCGFRVKKPQSHPGRPKNTNDVPQLLKVEALLTDMKLPWSYAHKLAEQMYQIKNVGWLGSEKLTGVITALIKKQSQEKTNG